MRAAEGGAHENGGRHISGSERLLCGHQLEEEAKELVARALAHERGQVDFIRITIDRVDKRRLQFVTALHAAASQHDSIDKAKAAAKTYLVQAGVHKGAAEKAIALLSASEDYPGAYIMNAQTGAIMNPCGKAVRVSRMDWKEGEFVKWCGTYGYRPSLRLQEAVALASKTAASSFTVAELCWSDDLRYLTGYVASRSTGYIRLSPLKKEGSPTGGRVFFVTEETDMNQYIHFLSEVPVMIRKEGKMNEPHHLST
ncbi:6-carboxyhexanoate--CoA ligase [Bacillus xiapuensis]|uniref:6-carboxyhexanoate--CoA ligase n=1 Tax=Bacillus xiapuensis TaxID=2014075 RepID=UPI000C24D74B|nr:6-carboxyhexanoate--CoA ligase [Bacillus xiapuensis]